MLRYTAGQKGKQLAGGGQKPSPRPPFPSIIITLQMNSHHELRILIDLGGRCRNAIRGSQVILGVACRPEPGQSHEVASRCTPVIDSATIIAWLFRLVLLCFRPGNSAWPGRPLVALPPPHTPGDKADYNFKAARATLGGGTSPLGAQHP